MPARLLLTLLTILLLSACSTAQVRFNGDFESIDPLTRRPAGWDNHMAFSSAYQADSSVVKKGRYSMSINSGNNAGYFAVSYIIPQVFKGKNLQLKGYVKTENVTGQAGMYVGVDGAQVFSDLKKQNINGNTDWKEYTLSVPYLDERAEQINIGVTLDGTGKAWFDDLRVYVDGKLVDKAAIRFNGYKARLDHEFDSRSGIQVIENNEQTVKNLALLAQVWGFIKYHHPAVARGDFNMDAELFRVMPAVLKAVDLKQVNSVIEQWVDKFGQPPACKDCKAKPTAKIALAPDYADLFNDEVVSTTLKNKLQYIIDNSNNKNSYYIKMAPNVGNPVFTNETEYYENVYAEAGYRMLLLFRYWNMVQYFAPYRDVVGRNWKEVLYEFIPKFILAADVNDHAVITLQLIAGLNDAHATIRKPLNGVQRFRGTMAPPFKAAFIENKLVVTGYYKDTLNVKDNFKTGDIITAVNGSTVEHLINLHMSYTSASNTEGKLYAMQKFIARSNQPSSAYQIIRDGVPLTIQQQNILASTINYHATEADKPDFKPFKLINKDIGYLYPGAYYNKDLPAIKAMFKNTKAIIVDMRCYPSEFMVYTFVPYIRANKSPFVKFSFGRIDRPGAFEFSEPLTIPAERGYKGKVIVIVDASTLSQAEYTTMALQSSPNVTVIGSTTAGADGNVSQIILPGGIQTGISGIGVFYPDGTPTQRKGVKIDVEVKPTIEGVKAERDELLEKAIELASK